MPMLNIMDVLLKNGDILNSPVRWDDNPQTSGTGASPVMVSFLGLLGYPSVNKNEKMWDTRICILCIHIYIYIS